MNAIPKTRIIQTAKELTLLLQELKQALTGGHLEQIYPETSLFAPAISLVEIPEEGPWPDYLELHFQNPARGKRYVLSVETYHGTGGSWGPK